MRKRSPFSALRFISLAMVLVAIILTAMQLVRFSRVRTNFPYGLKIAAIPVGGLDRQQAARRLLEAYAVPVVLHYNDSEIHLSPSVVDFQLDVESMLAAADLERTQKSFWQEFWDFLWGRTSSPGNVPLRSAYSEARLRTFLSEVAERYDQSPVAAMPVAGTVDFQPGKPGTVLDIDGSVGLIENALRTLNARDVDLPLRRSTPSRPAFRNLEVLLNQTLTSAGFEGLAGVYLHDLQTAQEVHFAWFNGEKLPVEPDIAFTASSIIKIPIMVATFNRVTNPDSETLKLMEDMIDRSGNEAADWLMNRAIDDRRAPLLVTEDMQALGLENTFLSGYFSAGSPLLATVNTPANQRTDINTDPDIYSQTTPSDVGMLLEDIYQCAQNGGGSLIAVFQGSISVDECQRMISYLANNHLPSLLTAGVPEGTQVAHKHGWVSNFGVINTIGDAGIIYTPGGNYVLVIFLHNQEQLVWEPSAALISELSRAVYNYFNVPTQ